MRQTFDQPFFTVGEYWSFELPILLKYLELVEHRMSLFDIPMLYRFHRASKSGNSFDISTILKDTLVSACPDHAVTLVANHDSQPLQSLDTPLEDWFKPLAYALILLRLEGYPCIFFGDYYGVHYTDKSDDGKDYDIQLTSFKSILDQMIALRKQFTYGLQQDYFDHKNTIGWTFTGDKDHPSSMAVLLTNGQPDKRKCTLTRSILLILILLVILRKESPQMNPVKESLPAQLDRFLYGLKKATIHFDHHK